jgi:hypothetical protein
MYSEKLHLRFKLNLLLADINLLHQSRDCLSLLGCIIEWIDHAVTTDDIVATEEALLLAA